MVKRVFVEKRPGFDIAAGNLKAELKDSLGIHLDTLRILNRYDSEGLEGADYTRAKNTIFSEQNADFVYEDKLPPFDGRAFAVEFLPGQYDQRADSAAQCVQLLTGKERPEIEVAQVYLMDMDISDEDFIRIQSYIINPVESRLASMDLPYTLGMKLSLPDSVEIVDSFTGKSDGEIAKHHAAMGFAMGIDDLAFCRDYFKSEGRDPSITELRVIDTYWSDHCRHTTFLTRLKEIDVEPGEWSAPIRATLEEYYDARLEVYGDRDKDVSLMDLATIGMKLLKKRGLIPDLDESEEINACSIELPVEIDGKTEPWLIQFKNETHNHPTEIEPFGGAATCLGGAIRDPLSGRAYVYQAMRVTGCADPTLPFEKTIPGKLPQKKITLGAAEGYSSYGNQIGLATGHVREIYDPGYVAKRLEIGAVIGASPKENVIRGIPSPGDIIVLLGGRTGRDGCGGATGSSKAHDLESIDNCGAEVQKGNPPTERKLQRLFRNPAAAKLIKRCNDFGAGGVCVAIGELADSLDVNLDVIPKKYEGLDGTELAISESQERMAVVLDQKDVNRFIALAGEENLEATPVAEVTDRGRLRMNWRGKSIVDLSREFLNTNGVTGEAYAYIAAPDKTKDYRNQVPPSLSSLSLADAFLKNLSRLEVASQKGLIERFDSTIGAASVLMPFGGKYQLTPEDAMVAKLPTPGKTDVATAMSYGYIPGISKFSPYHGAAFAVVESLAKLAAVGANPLSARLTFQEYFERLHDDERRWGKPAAALLGAFAAQKQMGIPSIGGKDSMSGSFNELDVPPTLVSFAVASTSAKATGSAALQKAGACLVYLPLPTDAYGLPDYPSVKSLLSLVYRLVREGQILACSVVGEGGAAATVAKMAFGNKIGVTLDVTDSSMLFAPKSGSFVVECDDPDMLDGAAYDVIGKTTGEQSFTIGGKQVPMETALAAWCGTLEPVFPTKAETPDPQVYNIPVQTLRGNTKTVYHKNFAKPRVFIPVFPGTNCEYDSEKAFTRAGGVCETFVVKNLTPGDITYSTDEICKRIKGSQIIMLPGGFSGGDEPDGSGKFIATTFRNRYIAEAVTDLLQNRDGLILGICNGFQALMKLGLLPYGKICGIKEDDPTLTFNSLGRHVSRMAYTRVASVKSPWLAGAEPGEVHTIALSHGEGRFVASDAVLRTLVKNGQVATQYAYPDGIPAACIEYNPNGSVLAIEGITSPDGRVFGKMGHSERMDEDCYKNVPGCKDQKLFLSGVQYFR